MEVVMVPDSIREEQISRLMSLYERDLLRMSYVYLHDMPLAEDAVQETFIKAYKSLNTFRGESSEKTWLMRIAINTCKDMRRAAWFRYVDRQVNLENLPFTYTSFSDEDSAITTEVMRLAQLNNDDVHTVDIIAASTYTYGLPGEKDITQKDAFAIAQKVIMERYYLDSQTVALYDMPYTYFDITDPAVPKWKIVFFPSFASADYFPDAFASGQGTLRYKVEINSQTGEVIKAEEFVEQSPSDPSYKMILY